MENIYNHAVKPICFFALSVITSLVSPIKDVLIVLAMSFMFNIITGIVTDIHVNHQEFNIKKAFDAIVQLTFYAALVYYIHNSLVTLNYHDMGDKTTVWVTIIVGYYYLTNIIRNSIQLFPKNYALKLIYLILTTKIFLYIKRFFSINKQDIDDNNLTPNV